MSRFEAALRQAESSLDLPGARRARILVEMAGDLEALYVEYRARGVPENEAIDRAAQALGITNETARELSRLHQPPYRRWTARLSERGRSRFERLSITGLCLALVASGAVGLAGGDFLQDPSAWIWPLLVLGALLVVSTSFMALHLYLTEEPDRARWLIHAIIAIALLALLTSLVGVVGELGGLAADITEAGDFSVRVLAPGMRRAAQASSLGMTVATAAFLVWFHARRRFDAMKRAEAEMAATIATKEA